jgi:hypothetical protein
MHDERAFSHLVVIGSSAGEIEALLESIRGDGTTIEVTVPLSQRG